MNAQMIDLRRNPGRILEAVENRETVILSRRGKPVAKISPLDAEASVKLQQHETFGMWKDGNQMSVDDQVKSLRRVRFHDI